jgi:hypothetical protein
MASDIDPRFADLYTPLQHDSIKLARELYGIQMMNEAAGLFDAVDLDDEAVRAFVGSVALRLDDIGFEDRREAVLNFRNLTSILGKAAVQNTEDQPPVLDLLVTEPPADEPTETVTAEAGPTEEAETHQKPADKPAETVQPNPESEQVKSNRAYNRLLLEKVRDTWLEELIDVEALTTFNNLSDTYQQIFAEALALKYGDLKVPRLGAAGRERRMKLIPAFLMGHSEEQILAIAEVNLPSLVVNKHLNGMLRSFVKQVGKDQLRMLLDAVSSDGSSQKGVKVEQPSAVSEQAIATEPDLPVLEQEAGLSKDHINWLKRIFPEQEMIDDISALDSSQLEHLADRLSWRLDTAVIKQLGPLKTQRRLQELKLFTSGLSYDEIAEEVQPTLKTTKDDLNHSATRLKATIPPQF